MLSLLFLLIHYTTACLLPRDAVCTGSVWTVGEGVNRNLRPYGELQLTTFNATCFLYRTCEEDGRAGGQEGNGFTIYLFPGDIDLSNYNGHPIPPTAITNSTSYFLQLHWGESSKKAVISITVPNYTPCKDLCGKGGYCSAVDNGTLGNCTCYSDTTNGFWGLNQRTGELCGECVDLYYGENCTTQSLCENGSCDIDTCYGTRGTGQCDYCDAYFYGSVCDSQSLCNVTSGACHNTTDAPCYGLNGTGNCSYCYPPAYGEYCDQAAVCVNGHCGNLTCYGTTGSGTCTYCNDLYFRPTCDSAVTCNTINGQCLNGTCQGVAGGGTCDLCFQYYVGSNCNQSSSCDTANGSCSYGSCYGIYSNDTGCDSCISPNVFGQNCDKPVLCNVTNGVCNNQTCHNIMGTGKCDDCRDGLYYFKEFCDTPVNCTQLHPDYCEKNERGKCYGVNGTGLCDKCPPNYFIQTCEKVYCNTEHGECHEAWNGEDGKHMRGVCWGLMGEGRCDSCKKGYYGPGCNQKVQCSPLHGNCSDGCSGVFAGGMCTNCLSDEYLLPSCTDMRPKPTPPPNILKDNIGIITAICCAALLAVVLLVANYFINNGSAADSERDEGEAFPLVGLAVDDECEYSPESADASNRVFF